MPYSTFLATFFFRTSAIPLGAAVVGVPHVHGDFPLGIPNPSGKKSLRLASLWPLGTLATVAGSAIAVEYLFNRSDPLLALA